jgi:hypothetical protein
MINLSKCRFQQRKCFIVGYVTGPEQYHSGSVGFRQCNDPCEIKIGRYEDPIFIERETEDRLIRPRRHSALPNVERIMPGASKPVH